MSKAVLVTGGAGYIGSHTCAVLASQGYQPIVLDNLVYGHREAVKWGPLFEGSISDSKLVGDILQKYKIESVLHFAAYAYVGESVLDPLKYYQNNVSETIVLLQTLVQHKISRFVFSSTCATYGDPKMLPIDEMHPQVPINPYGASKLMVERVLQDLAVAKKLNSVALRYFNAAGACPEYDLGEDHDPETHLIPLVLKSMLPGGSKIKVFGDDYPTRDGSCLRDYIHVFDLATAHVKALEHLETSGKAWDVFNLGTGSGHSTLEVIAAASKVVGTEIPFDRAPRRAGDPAELVADSAKALAKLGWKPERSDLQTILSSAWAYHKK
ncbi:MAG: UDP-glucose 4-epimerase GalE [Bdellovibrio sp.]